MTINNWRFRSGLLFFNHPVERSSHRVPITLQRCTSKARITNESLVIIEWIRMSQCFKSHVKTWLLKHWKLLTRLWDIYLFILFAKSAARTQTDRREGDYSMGGYYKRLDKKSLKHDLPDPEWQWTVLNLVIDVRLRYTSVSPIVCCVCQGRQSYKGNEARFFIKIWEGGGE